MYIDIRIYIYVCVTSLLPLHFWGARSIPRFRTHSNVKPQSPPKSKQSLRKNTERLLIPQLILDTPPTKLQWNVFGPIPTSESWKLGRSYLGEMGLPRVHQNSCLWICVSFHPKEKVIGDGIRFLGRPEKVRSGPSCSTLPPSQTTRFPLAEF